MYIPLRVYSKRIKWLNSFSNGMLLSEAYAKSELYNFIISEINDITYDSIRQTSHGKWVFFFLNLNIGQAI